ncbi:TetR family transcriptional regulator C-terminal domain-containing protein [Gynuella sp.]|uniref:acrylate utilization transcriptional regulator AcuR n=1 Tax=Gynuella sp. TaxID=2969146 RepID=UPI003D0CF25F
MSELKRKRGRPKVRPDSHTDTKEALLQSGLEWLTQSGFCSSSLDSILRSIQIPKGSFYHYFASKEDFGLAVLERYRLFFEHKLDKHLLDESHSPISRLKNFMHDATMGIERYQFARGCLVGNLEQEIQTLPANFKQAIVDTYLSWQKRVEMCLIEAKQQQQIGPDEDTEALAKVFWIGWEGAVSRARLLHSSAPLEQFGTFFLERLQR